MSKMDARCNSILSCFSTTAGHACWRVSRASRALGSPSVGEAEEGLYDRGAIVLPQPSQDRYQIETQPDLPNKPFEAIQVFGRHLGACEPKQTSSPSTFTEHV